MMGCPDPMACPDATRCSDAMDCAGAMGCPGGRRRHGLPRMGCPNPMGCPDSNAPVTAPMPGAARMPRASLMPWIPPTPCAALVPLAASAQRRRPADRGIGTRPPHVLPWVSPTSPAPCAAPMLWVAPAYALHRCHELPDPMGGAGAMGSRPIPWASRMPRAADPMGCTDAMDRPDPLLCPHLGANQIEVKLCARSAQFKTISAERGPNSAKFGRMRPRTLGRFRTALGRKRPKLGQIRPSDWSQCWRMGVDTKIGPTSTEVGPNPAEFWTSSADFGPMSAETGQKPGTETIPAQGEYGTTSVPYQCSTNSSHCEHHTQTIQTPCQPGASRL